ncbi:alpha/beta-hydrolase [Auricularia subglabra TFB-10046 SS5]|nr:alpha/beta-hydrolase [Auricularia subglabra TFB-10046 SS5]
MLPLTSIAGALLVFGACASHASPLLHGRTQDRNQFLVPGSAIPLLSATVQDSFAGRLPITSAVNETRQLFFWYWPADSPSDKLSIWLNGGPGCSSLEGFLQELGPVSFKPGASAPSVNPFSWTQVSDMLFIDQPVGTGFSIGTPDIHDEIELSNEFYGFLQEFYATFPELASKQTFLTGESYAGMYVPYIATRILQAAPDEKAVLSLDLQGLLINDGVYSSDVFGRRAPIAAFALAKNDTLKFRDAWAKQLQDQSRDCGFDAVMAQLKYPPDGPIIWKDNSSLTRSIIWGQYVVDGTLADVFLNDKDLSPPSEVTFPALLASLPRGIMLWHGLDDAVLLSNGSRLTIQNLTWGGVQGFQTAPYTPLILDGAVKGVHHTERNLTYIEVENAGHMIPEDQPEVALHVFMAFLGLETL